MIFNDRVADVAERFLKKGAKIYVEGSLQTRKWTDQQGQERYTTEVVIGRFNGQLTMLDGRSGGEGGGFGGGVEAAPGLDIPLGNVPRPQPLVPPPLARARSGGPSWDAPKGGDLDDEIPF